ncbi:hypothetical protein [Schlesneria paludicola]|uniref:hypothetical protein n=1 Tax=Schlesneria paludicola TaxID=360056 RepID=UPI00029A8224|nr:hypothetical protein [Schlesneria paludicola]
MARRPIALLVLTGLTSLALIVAGIVPTEVAAANKSAKKPSKATKKPIRNPKFDPTADKVDLFDAVDSEQVGVRLVPNDAMGGTVLIENKTDKPLTVKVPEAVVGVAVNSQFGGGGMGGGGMGGGGMGGGGMGGGGGGQQAMGGGMGGGMMGGGGMGGGMMGGGGGGMFSVPPESVVAVPFKSVCLEHGKTEPNSRSKYTVIPVAKFNSDPALYQLLSTVGAGKVDPQAAQAAAWHLSSKMSFEDLANKMNEPLGGFEASPYFSREQLMGAQQLVAEANGRAVEEADAKSESADDKPAEEPRSSRVTRK